VYFFRQVLIDVLHFCLSHFGHGVLFSIQDSDFFDTEVQLFPRLHDLILQILEIGYKADISLGGEAAVSGRNLLTCVSQSRLLLST